MTITTSTVTDDEIDAVKTRQQATWASGNYAAIGSTLQIVGENLVEAAGIEAGQRVLDVAAGNGNAALAAARRHADVLATDYVPGLLDQAASRAAANGLHLRVESADAESLPYEDMAFDAALSVFGVMFAPRQSQVAAELVRVTKPGGTIAIANWTPNSFIGDLFRTIAKYVPAPPVPSVFHWGSPGALADLFGPTVDLVTVERTFVFRYTSAEHFVDNFRRYYGPTHKAFAALEAKPDDHEQLAADLVALANAQNRSRSGALAVPSTYLEAIARRR